jgi:PKD repeat protein
MEHKKLVFIPLIILMVSLGNCGCLEEETSPLIARFSYYPANPTTNDMIQFHDESDHSNGNITAWHWDFDITDEYSRETSTLQHPTYRYMWGYGATFKVKLTVTDDQGNTDSITKKIKIVDQLHLPEGDDISLEILSYERKTHNLDGDVLPQYGFTCVWLELKMENNWYKEIYPTVGWDGIVSWGGSFYIYVFNHTKHHWGHSGIYPETTPEKLSPGENAVWTVTFWIPESSEEYKVKYAYLYDISYEWLRFRDTWPQQIAIWAFL